MKGHMEFLLKLLFLHLSKIYIAFFFNDFEIIHKETLKIVKLSWESNLQNNSIL